MSSRVMRSPVVGLILVKNICWITQLVVHKEYRERGLATGLITHLREPDDNVFGIMSSHPAACLAAAKVSASKCTNLYFRT